MRLFGKILLWFMAVLGFPMLIMIVFGISLAFNLKKEIASVEPNAVLWLDLDRPIPERAGSGNLFEQYDQASFLDYLQAIERAKTDDRIIAIAAEINGGIMGIAQTQELRDALIDFQRESGKKAYVYAEDLGAMGGGMLSYYLATGFSEIWLNPTGGVGVSGMAMEIPYFADALEKIDITAEMEQRHEYKGGADPFIRSQMTEPVRASLQGLLDDWHKQLAAGMTTSRQSIAAEIDQLVLNSPYLPQQSLELGLVDRLAYWDEFEDLIDYLPEDTESHTVSVSYYMLATDLEIEETDEEENNKSYTIAVIQGIGPITGEDYGPGYYTDETFSPYTVSKALANAREDSSIDAVLFRVNSPGGAYAQSDMVRREVLKLKEARIPVIVSMGDNAASGGYFVSMGADYIVAQPGTLTGSIGVYAGKVATKKLWDNLGVNWERVETGPQAGMWSMISEFTPSQKAKFQESLDFVYTDFSGKAAQDRGLDATEIDAAARGRIWTGQEAIGIKLVDELGGYKEALDAARIALETEKNAKLNLQVFPKQPTPVEQIEAIFSSDDPLRYISIQVSDHFIERQIPDWVLQVRDQFTSHGLLTMPIMKISD
ncbi:signal peptide peptidase SppA [Curvivirga sp.]|uniref:signal peptide peptidase SppA n=1 Tax=Curvivirga sp. TaxID=2856848 RepID=UPI003B5C12C2